MVHIFLNFEFFQLRGNKYSGRKGCSDASGGRFIPLQQLVVCQCADRVRLSESESMLALLPVQYQVNL